MKTLISFSMVLLSVQFLASFANADDACPATSDSCVTASDEGQGCQDLVPNTLPVAQFQAQCASQHGSTFKTTPCPTANLVGSCALSFGGKGEFMVMRMYSPFPAEMVAQVCAQANARVCK